MKLFITARFKKTENKEEIERLCSIVREAGFDDFCFIRDIEHYQKTFDDPRELMNRARAALADCDALLIDMSDAPSGGRVIEAGMAFGMKKRLIISMKEGTHLKEAFRGIADTVIEYRTENELQKALEQLATAWAYDLSQTPLH